MRNEFKMKKKYFPIKNFQINVSKNVLKNNRIEPLKLQHSIKKYDIIKIYGCKTYKKL